MGSCQTTPRCRDTTMETFEEDCKNAVTGLDLMNIAETYHQILTASYDDHKVDSNKFKKIYNDYIGWALPSQKACQLVIDEWQKDPSRRIVDLGAGTGLFCKVFHDLGVPGDKLIAVDITNPTHTPLDASIERKEFWHINLDNNYKPNPEDILFIAWGTSGIDDIVDDYVERGGKCIIILGETNVTYDPEQFMDSETEKPKEDWWVELHHVPGALSIYAEQLSINKNIRDMKMGLLWILIEKYNTWMGY